ncbi:redox-regulated ATPase YchF [Candidatus Curtissbacteria bacterium]|nr:redox-regulated ATPase YchF [Candidatus Curtissbacteria bacterium]
MSSLFVGIVGLPNVGKSTLFNALLKKQVAEAKNYPFTTIEPNVGVVEVPDPRLGALKETVEKSEGLSPGFKVIPAIVRFVDIAGLVKGAHKGEGLGNQFLSHIREVDAIVFVVRDFKNPDIIQTGTSPKDDLEVLKDELLLKDLETLEKRIDSFNRELKTATQNDPRRKILETMEAAKKLIEEGKWLADVMEADDLEKIKELSLLSAKKYMVVVNSDESALSGQAQGPTLATGQSAVYEQGRTLFISAKLEEELSALSDEEAVEYLKEVGLEEPGLVRLIKKGYELLNLATYLTAGPKEVRAWTIKVGSLAPQAAGVIHTDFERGFIAADVIDWRQFVDLGGWKAARAAGKVLTIGKKDEVCDGMVVEFRFSV